MGNLIGDEIPNTFAVVDEPDEITPLIKERYSGLVVRITINLNHAPSEQRVDLVKALSQS